MAMMNIARRLSSFSRFALRGGVTTVASRKGSEPIDSVTFLTEEAASASLQSSELLASQVADLKTDSLLTYDKSGKRSLLLSLGPEKKVPSRNER